MEEINNFQQEPNENLYQAWERFKELLMKCPQHYLTEMQEVILFYNGLGIPTRQILDSRGGIPSKTIADAKVAVQEMAKYSQKWHNGTSCSKNRSTETSDGVASLQDNFINLGEKRLKTAAAPGLYQRNNANHSYQEQRQSIEDTLSKFMSESTKRHEENSNLIKEIRASTDAAIRNQGASIKTLEIQIRQLSKVLQERGFRSLPSSTKANPRDQVKSISTTIEADSYPIRRIGSSQYTVSTQQNRTLIKEKDLGSFTLVFFINNACFDNALVDLGASVSVMALSTYLNLGLGELAHTKLTVELADTIVKYPKGITENVLVGIDHFFSTAHAKIDVYKRKITLRVRDKKITFKSVKSASSLIKRVYMLSLRERMERDLEARIMGETLVLNRSLDPLNGDYIEFNDLNKPFGLRRNQGDDLMPTIGEGEVIEEFKTRDYELDIRIGDYPSCCDYDKKIHIDCAHNLKFSCMIGFEFTHANFFPLLYVSVMYKKFHNSIMKGVY
ncbi:mitochondrial proton/calcium exchanger protein-like protein isoform X1 [Tanacetum coccineum]